MNTIRVMVQEICIRNQHGFRQTPSKATSHHNTETIVKQFPSQLTLKDITIALHNAIEDMVGWLKICSYFIHKANVKIWITNLLDLIISPMYQCLRDFDTIQIRRKK